jgi:outer membrane biosynthesis protein TonB
MSTIEKVILFVVLLVAGAGATIYVQNAKSNVATAYPTPTTPVEVPATPPVPTEPAPTPVAVTPPVPTPTVVAVPTVPKPIPAPKPTPTPAPVALLNKKATVVYHVPDENTESITVNVSIKSGIISDVSFSSDPTNPTSAEFYQSFVGQFSKSALVGKKLAGVSLSRVGGASLTTAAFNRALAEM